jgi:hypothetical protein
LHSSNLVSTANSDDGINRPRVVQIWITAIIRVDILNWQHSEPDRGRGKSHDKSHASEITSDQKENKTRTLICIEFRYDMTDNLQRLL